ncbi:MAG: hypothetical protein EZS28_051829, partial [Streblomastix strix]
NDVAVMNPKRKESAAPFATSMKKICLETMQQGLIIHPVHIRCLDNKKSDAKCRFEMAGDYQIRTKYMTIALQQLDLTLQEDMFATEKNAKCKIYYSPTQEDTAAGTEELQAIWSNKIILLNPPMILMGQVIQNLRTVSNCTTVVIAMD